MNASVLYNLSDRFPRSGGGTSVVKKKKQQKRKKETKNVSLKWVISGAIAERNLAQEGVELCSCVSKRYLAQLLVPEEILVVVWWEK